MCAKWKEGFTPEILASRFEDIKQVDKDKVSFKGFGYELYHAMLESMVDYDSKIPFFTQRGLQRKAIKKAASMGTITHNTILRFINEEEKLYLAQEKKDFVLLSHVTIRNNLILPRFVIDGSAITFSRSIPKHFNKDHYDHPEHTRTYYWTDFPKGSQCVRIRVSARDEHDAANIAINKIDFLRSIMNLKFNSGYRQSSGPSKPVNVVLLGPLHTLHEPDGSTASYRFWYQPGYYAKDTLNLSNKSEKLLKFIRHVRKKIKSHNYSAEIKDILQRYVQALDIPDYNTSLINLWGVLEALTITKRENYEVCVRRAAALWTEKEFHLQVLKHLKSYRNSYIHSGESYDDVELYLYQLKGYVDNLLMFHINNYFDLKDLAQAQEFMDSVSRDAKYLKHKKKLLRDSFKFQGIPF